MFRTSAWLSFERAPSQEQMQSIEDRLEFLADVLPRYLAAGDLDTELEDLDLDLNTFLGVAVEHTAMTPWLVHSDWLGDIAKDQLSPEADALVGSVREIAAVARGADLAQCLRKMSELLNFLAATDQEAGGIASLAALDTLAYLMLANIGLSRLRKLG